MTVAPPLILVGARDALLHALPRKSCDHFSGPLFSVACDAGIGREFRSLRFCWLPRPRTAGMACSGGIHGGICNRKAWHAVEHACFLGSGIFFSGGPLCSRAECSGDGRVGRCSSTFFSLPCRVTFSPHFLRSAPCCLQSLTFQRRSTLGFPLSKTSNAQAH